MLLGVQKLVLMRLRGTRVIITGVRTKRIDLQILLKACSRHLWLSSDCLSMWVVLMACLGRSRSSSILLQHVAPIPLHLYVVCHFSLHVVVVLQNFLLYHIMSHFCRVSIIHYLLWLVIDHKELLLGICESIFLPCSCRTFDDACPWLAWAVACSFSISFFLALLGSSTLL